ncbi:MAG: hypothetical protein M1526_07000 [Candidatus Thermoplasmatota archaeon]|jgi:uncharacterized membrane protein|nr:hypothetical protein [Candidatus Thermoplasmatota archaeon]MCL5680431.1 hypothetical protein [Candidatus Thermoplasmatota archaeon]
MTTENAVEKMRELMASVDSINRFSNVRKTLPLLVIITLVSVLSSFVIVALIDVYDFLTVSFPGNIMISNVSIGGWLIAGIAWIAGIVSVYIVMRRAYNRPHELKWNEDLEEGPIGIIKIMSRYDWEKILEELKYAKQGFILVSVLQLLLVFLLTVALLFLSMATLMAIILQTNANGYYILFAGLIITLILGDKTLAKLYKRIWNADILIDELRRFHLEIDQREF